MSRLALCLLAFAPLGAQPTFTRDIAPIVHEHCAGCHRPGEAGPFPLLTYEDARRHARDLVRVTASRYMPPWPPAPGFGDFEGARRLTEAQLAVLRQWADAGAPQGDPAAAPRTPSFPEGWQLGKPT